MVPWSYVNVSLDDLQLSGINLVTCIKTKNHMGCFLFIKNCHLESSGERFLTRQPSLNL